MGTPMTFGSPIRVWDPTRSRKTSPHFLARIQTRTATASMVAESAEPESPSITSSSSRKACGVSTCLGCCKTRIRQHRFRQRRRQGRPLAIQQYRLRTILLAVQRQPRRIDPPAIQHQRRLRFQRRHQQTRPLRIRLPKCRLIRQRHRPQVYRRCCRQVRQPTVQHRSRNHPH